MFLFIKVPEVAKKTLTLMHHCVERFRALLLVHIHRLLLFTRII
jgi:hypothetical protein